MSRRLSRAEIRICQMVSAVLGIMVFAFFVFNVIDSLFGPSPPARIAQARPDITGSTGRDFVQTGRSSPLTVRKDAAEDALPEEPAQGSRSHRRAGLEKLREVALEKTLHFDSRPLQQSLEANDPAPADTVSTLASPESFQLRSKAGVATANAGHEPSSIEPSQETKSQPEPDPPPQRNLRDAAPGTESLTHEQVLQIRSRLRDLGYLSTGKSDAWDAGAREALRDFKLVNDLAKNELLDVATIRRLNAPSAVRADQSIIGNWSEAPCRSAGRTNVQLSISSHRAKSSGGSVCEFADLRRSDREWRVRANCSQGTKHWVANGRFALNGNKLVWTSERDVISYVRCN
jgi:hypothetical protein